MIKTRTETIQNPLKPFKASNDYAEFFPQKSVRFIMIETLSRFLIRCEN